MGKRLDPPLTGKQTGAVPVKGGQNRNELTVCFKGIKKAFVEGSGPEEAGRSQIETIGIDSNDRC
jgi:hypothetical protein